MSTLSVRLPKSLHDIVRELSKEEGISINQLIVTALAEKISALKTVDYLKQKANQASREKFLKALDEVPDIEPFDNDKI